MLPVKGIEAMQHNLTALGKASLTDETFHADWMGMRPSTHRITCEKNHWSFSQCGAMGTEIISYGSVTPFLFGE